MIFHGVDLNKIPLVPNPSGAPPDFAHGPSLEPAYMGVGISLVTISSILVILRLFANTRRGSKLQIDDYLCAVSWLTAVGYWGVLGAMVMAGVARHAWDVPIGIFTASYVKQLLAQQILLYFSLFAVKASILCFFIRVFDSIRWVRFTAYFLIFVLFAWHTTMIVLWINFSVPHGREHWGPKSIGKATAKTVEGLVVLNGIENLCVDSIMFLLPFPSILGLQMRTRKKIGLLLVFAVATCSVTAAGFGFAYRLQAYHGAKGDPTWVAIKVAIASTGELFGALIVSCAPGVAAFWHRVVAPSKFYFWFHCKVFGCPPDVPMRETGPDDIRYSFDSEIRRLTRKDSDQSDYSTSSKGSEPGEEVYYKKKLFQPPTDFITSAIPEPAPTAGSFPKHATNV